VIINGREIPWRNFAELLHNKEVKHGDSLFAEIAGESISYRDLAVRSRAIAANLLARGFSAGDRIASFTHNCAEQILLWFGCCQAGLVWVPINSGLVGEDLTYILRNSGARALVFDEECGTKIDRLAEIVGGIELFATYEHSSVERFSSLTETVEAPAERPQTEPSVTGAILYTGGTTGLPKGVVLPQLSFILAGIRYGEVFAVRAGERHYSTMPLYHAGGLQWSIMGPLVNDMSTVIDKRFSASRYFERVRETRANIIDPFGAVVTMLCKQPAAADDRNHSVRVAVGAVHGLPPHIPGQFATRFNIPLINLYGLTEGGGAMLTSNREGAGSSNGKPHGWVDIQITDENDCALAPGEVGEILLRPNYPHMFMSGYFDEPASSLKAFRDCWLHTGDLGRMDEDGNLFFLGRRANWIRRRGESISALEIETILGKHPEIREIAVVGVPSELGEEDIKAFIVPAGDPPDPAIMCDWALERMAAFKVPRYFEFVDEFPRSSAKQEIQRSILKGRPHDAAFDREERRHRQQSSRTG
jgi:crotonobetaine/carnitine-CoA ligase